MLLTFNCIAKVNYTMRDDNGDILENKKNVELFFGIDNVLSETLSHIENMKIGEVRSFILQKNDAFGDVNSELIVSIPKKHIDNFDFYEIGTYLSVGEDDFYDNLSGIVIAKDSESLTVDFNHPFAGKTIYYTIELLSIRKATDFEMENRISLKNRS
ncbi:FKBP-type peptidyl-prolyl cis-trans isomerase [bacterium]|nr:FKBP-type peptidyl-prolyl cis-trans isomerase [bacterium]